MESEACPKWKIEYEEQYHKPDYKVLGYSIYVKCDINYKWVKLYTTYDYNECMLALNKLKYTLYDLLIKPYILNNQLPVMVEINDQIYKVIDISINHSCIIVEQIKNNINYGKYEQDFISYDYIESFILPFKQDELLVHNNQIFLNGELLYNRNETIDLCNQIGQDVDLLAYNNKPIVTYLFNLHKNIKCYICEGDYIKNTNNRED